jgi:hypothetical protein
MKRFVFGICVTLLLGWGSTSTLLSLLRQTASATSDAGIRYVALDGSDASDCSSSANRCRTPQRAVDVADVGDVIKVAAGTYSGTQGRASAPFYHGSAVVTQIVYISRSLTIRGGYSTSNGFADPPTSVTALAPQGQGRGIYIAPGITVTLEGLQLIGGDAAGLGGGGAPSYLDSGGGLYADRSETLISDCLFADNHAISAGGIYVNSGVLVLQTSVITANVAITGNAGGLQVYSPAIATISHNIISSNTSGFNGGGLYLAYGLSDTVISNNVISSNRAGAGGGGIYMNSGASFIQNEVTNNRAGSGGAIYVNSRSPLVLSNQIVGNEAVHYGGGAYLRYDTTLFQANSVISNTSGRDGGGLMLFDSEGLLENNVVAQNQVGNNESGAGIFVWGGAPRLVHTTLAQNHGGDGSGVYLRDDSGNAGSVSLTNTILVSQTIGLIAQSGNTAILNGILWYGNLLANVSGSGIVNASHEITGSPGFIDAEGWNYHIHSSSAAIDNGVTTHVQVDIDGQPRLGVPDIGADELVWSVYLPVVLSLSP